jgi:hypothetical protein
VVDCTDKTLKMYYDNQPTVFYAHNNKSSKATRPIEVKYYVVKDKIQDHTISLEHIRTKDMLADRGENGTDYFRPTNRPKVYGRQKQIRSDSCRIWSRIRFVINGYGKGYGFTNIRPYPKIIHISWLHPENIR